MLSKIVLRGQSEAFQIRYTYILMQMLFGGNLGFYKSGESKKRATQRLSSSAQIRGYSFLILSYLPQRLVRGWWVIYRTWRPIQIRKYLHNTFDSFFYAI